LYVFTIIYISHNYL
jgi:hypothetical protein